MTFAISARWTRSAEGSELHSSLCMRRVLCVACRSVEKMHPVSNSPSAEPVNHRWILVVLSSSTWLTVLLPSTVDLRASLHPSATSGPLHVARDRPSLVS